LKRRIIAGARGEEMNAATRRGNSRHCRIGARCAYAVLWNSLPTLGNSMQTVRKLVGDGRPKN
jgi:hypothetical protein